MEYKSQFCFNGDPYSGIEFEKRDAVITDDNGNDVFRATDLEFPRSWSQLATNVVASKYFQKDGDKTKAETSVKQMIDRVAYTIAKSGMDQGYFDTEEDMKRFGDDLAWICVNQIAAFNSPVWFNVGVEDEPQCSACFINSVDDSIEGIMDLAATESKLFKYGSGSGTNYSSLRSSREKLSNGGIPSGPVSFMEGLDSFAGVIKSGGKCLAPWQKVYTDRGPIPVSELEDKDFVVYSFDIESAKFVSKNAKCWKQDIQKFICFVYTEKGKYCVSVDHPFWVNGYVSAIPASSLVPGMSLLQFSESMDENDDHKVLSEEVIKVEILNDKSDVYAIEVVCDSEDDKTIYSGHNYVIFPEWQEGIYSKSGVVVFNTRRSAKMCILNADHPDINEFIDCKVKEEKKAWDLIDAGYDGSINGEAYGSIKFQNGNNSVRVSDEFMQAAVDNKTYWTKDRNGNPVEELNARDVLMKIAEGTHICGDPGIQFDDTINHWHTTKTSGMINASNPCVTGDTLVDTIDGEIRIDELVGKKTSVLSYNGEYNPIKGSFVTGVRKVYLLETDTKSIRLTSDHLIHTKYGDVAAKDLNAESKINTTNGWESIKSFSYIGEETVYDLTEPETNHFIANGIVVHNCSEFLAIDNSACNLASINLIKFLKDDNSFDHEAFRKTINAMILAQDIIIDMSKYPTDKIAQNSHDFRFLGLGHSNLGSLLMRLGLPYDSDEGRRIAAIITSYMTSAAYDMSNYIAKDLGSFKRFDINKESILDVIKKHKNCIRDIGDLDKEKGKTDCFSKMSDDSYGLYLGIQYDMHLRNAQVTVLAPCGTIGIMMDCDTTGIEPELSLVKYKKLVGGGMMKFTNGAVENALRTKGYNKEDIKEIVQYVDEKGTIEGSKIKDEHLPIFDCAFVPEKGKRSIDPEGHIKMMGAVQPFLSGAISKTVNASNDATVEDIFETYVKAWKLGLKAVAIYRDGSKRTQPLTTKKSEKTVITKPDCKCGGNCSSRKKMPPERQSITHKFDIAGNEGYITAGTYEDGSLGEIFVTMAKQGSFVSGLMDGFATAISIGLQQGVPLESFSSKFCHTQFAPNGFTTNADIRMAKSVLDYIFRWLNLKFGEKNQEQNHEEAEVPKEDSHNFVNDIDAPPCPECGSITVRNGSCHKCMNCGTSMGCS